MLKATITDSEALRAITPEMLKAYLESHGWAAECGPNFVRYSLDGRSVLMPIWHFTDYALRMSEAIQELSAIEARSQLDIYCELVGKPTYEELERELARRTTGEAAAPEHRCPCD